MLAIAAPAAPAAAAALVGRPRAASLSSLIGVSVGGSAVARVIALRDARMRQFGTVMANESAHSRASDAARRADESLQRATFALNNRRPEEAEQIAGGVLKVEPRNAKALRILGYALLMQGRAAAAIATLEGAVRGGRHDPELETQLALAFRQAGRDDDALARLKRAIKRRPPYAPAFYELGCLLAAMKRHDEAIEALNRGLEVAPAMPELSIELGHVLLARREPAAAKIAFARALAVAPNSASALWGMGKAHQQVGEDPAAVGFFRQCLMQMPNDAGTWLNLGHSLLETGDTSAGYDCFRTAARGDHKRYYSALTTLVKSGRGRFWLKPSAANRFLRGEGD
jgi:tetratricopeptide (TPR) repeat protein